MNFDPRETVVPSQEVRNRLKRREGEKIMDAINRIANYRQQLYLDRSSGQVEDENLWLEELVTCDRLLESLWEERRIELYFLLYLNPNAPWWVDVVTDVRHTVLCYFARIGGYDPPVLREQKGARGLRKKSRRDRKADREAFALPLPADTGALSE